MVGQVVAQVFPGFKKLEPLQEAQFVEAAAVQVEQLVWQAIHKKLAA